MGARGEIDQATTELRALVETRPSFAPARVGLGGLLAAAGRLVLAREQFQAALAARPDWPPALNGLARLSATQPDAAIADGPTAAQVAQRAVALTHRRSAVMLDTLAVALAAVGRYEEAARIAREAIRVALSARQNDLAISIRSRLDRYRQRQPSDEAQWDPAVGVAVAYSGR